MSDNTENNSFVKSLVAVISFVSDSLFYRGISNAIEPRLKEARERGGEKEVYKEFDKICFGEHDEFYESNEYKASQNTRFSYSIGEAMSDFKWRVFKKKAEDKRKDEVLSCDENDKDLLLYKNQFKHNYKILKKIRKYIKYLAKNKKYGIIQDMIDLGFVAFPVDRDSCSGPYIYEKRYQLEFHIIIENQDGKREGFYFDQSNARNRNTDIRFGNAVDALKYITNYDFEKIKNTTESFLGFRTQKEMIDDFNTFIKE